MRAFVAVDVEATARVRDLLQALRQSEAHLRVVPPENLHLTLKFLGEVEEGRTGAVTDVLEAAARGLAPFTMVLRGTGAFPRLTAPRVLWIGVEGADSLVAFAQRLEDGLAALGFPQGRRPFAPHLTVARVKGTRGRRALVDLLGAHRDDPFGEQRVEALRLKRSELRPTGAVHQDVAAVSLG